MPFLEALLSLILIILIIVAVIAGVLVGGYVLICVSILGFITGWLPILMCISDANMNIGEGFIGTWALWSIYLYSTILVGFLGFVLLRPDPDKLPPILKFMSMFYVPETTKAARSAGENANSNFDWRRFAETMRDTPSSIYTSYMQARAMRRESEKMKAESERMKAAADLAEEAVNMERHKARQQAFEEELKGKHD